MIMEEVMILMKKVQEKQNEKKTSYMLWQKQISSATASKWYLAGHACFVATPPSMLCKPHSFKIKVQWTAHNINNKNK